MTLLTVAKVANPLMEWWSRASSVEWHTDRIDVGIFAWMVKITVDAGGDM